MRATEALPYWECRVILKESTTAKDVITAAALMTADECEARRLSGSWIEWSYIHIPLPRQPMSLVPSPVQPVNAVGVPPWIVELPSCPVLDFHEANDSVLVELGLLANNEALVDCPDV